MWKNSKILSSGWSSGSARIRTVFKSLEKKRKRLEEEIATINKYLELSETLYRLEADKAKLASLSSQIITDEKGARPLPVTDVTDQSREILLGRSKCVGMSVPEAAYRILREAKRSMHAKKLLQRLLEGGMQIKRPPPSLRSPPHSRGTNVSGKWALIPLKLWKKH